MDHCAGSLGIVSWAGKGVLALGRLWCIAREEALLHPSTPTLPIHRHSVHCAPFLHFPSQVRTPRLTCLPSLCAALQALLHALHTARSPFPHVAPARRDGRPACPSSFVFWRDSPSLFTRPLLPLLPPLHNQLRLTSTSSALSALAFTRTRLHNLAPTTHPQH